MNKLTWWGVAVLTGVLIVVAIWCARVTWEDRNDAVNTALDQSEEKENTRLKTFFSELKSVYGYLYSTENGKFQLFIKIDEALLQGELAGSLLIMEVDTEDKNNPYEERRYVLNGITDGHMVKFITTVDGKKATLEGHFIKGATSFDLSFWKTDEKLVFNAVTEEEFKQSYEEFKTKVKNRKDNKCETYVWYGTLLMKKTGNR